MVVSFVSYWSCYAWLLLGSSLSWSHGSWIFNYMCNQCLSSLMMWARSAFIARYSRCNTMWKTISATFGMSVFFLGYPPIRLTAMTSWIIVVSGVKHYKQITTKPCTFFFVYQCLTYIFWFCVLLLYHVNNFQELFFVYIDWRQFLHTRCNLNNKKGDIQFICRNIKLKSEKPFHKWIIYFIFRLSSTLTPTKSCKKYGCWFNKIIF